MHNIAMMLFPEVTIQDFIGPFEVFQRIEEFSVHTFSPLGGTIRTEGGLEIANTASADGLLFCDILFVPGGTGVNKIIADPEILRKIHDLGKRSRMVTSVCTGSLVLAAADLLTGYHATTHWRYLDLLPIFGALPVADRVVIDRDRITGGGVTAGLDFALTVVSKLVSETRAREIAQQLEYNPAPPFASGHPSVALPETLASVEKKTQANYELRKKIMTEAHALAQASDKR
jgi:cyclohexyl-isocyanide hydratase